jgi:uncharacterized secreted repeat protein (TIGR03808 family)
MATLSRRTVLALPTFFAANAALAQDSADGLINRIAKGGQVVWPAGEYSIDGPIRINKSVRIEGNNTVVFTTGTAFQIDGGSDISISGLKIVNRSAIAALIDAKQVSQLVIENCSLEGGAFGLSLESCSGNIRGNSISGQADAGIFSSNAKALEIASNTVSNCGNNGIQVWQSDKREDGTIVHHNRISDISARAGGSGQNGNGINVFRAGNVIVSTNRISDCAYSAVRNNGGDNCQIIGNAISRTAEVGIYVEFEFAGTIIANNVLDDVGFGISVTNFDVGGRMATVSGNIIRRAKGSTTEGVKAGGGIFAEADTIVANNIVEDARDFGIGLGWGDKCRNLSANSNLIRRTPRGILVSVTNGAKQVRIAGNQFDDVAVAIEGRDYETVRTGDLLLAPETAPAHVYLIK